MQARESSHYDVRPWRWPVWANKDHARCTPVQGALELVLPRLPGDQAPFLEKDTQITLRREASGDVLHGRSVVPIVAEECIIIERHEYDHNLRTVWQR